MQLMELLILMKIINLLVLQKNEQVFTCNTFLFFGFNEGIMATDDYTVSDISLEFNVVGDRVEYIFYCDVDFYVRMFGHSYPTITQRVELTGYHNTKF